MLRRFAVVLWAIVILSSQIAGPRGVPAGEPGRRTDGKSSRPYPALVTDQTRSDDQVLAALQRPGKVFFSDDFESPESVKKHYDVVLSTGYIGTK